MVVVGGLLLIAFIVGLVLWVTMGNDDSSGIDATTTLLPATTAQASTPQAPALTSVRTFDPDGNNEERDELAALAVDNDLTTAWTTVCYASQYLGGKQGVGLVADLGAAGTGTLNVALGSAPYQLKVFAAPDGAQPTTFAGWGSAVKSFDGREVATVSVELAEPTRYVLVSFNELGADNGCSDNPYRGVIKEISFE